MTVTIYELFEKSPKYKLIMKDSKCEIIFKSDKYAQLYCFINNCMKSYNYDRKEDKNIYSTSHLIVGKSTTYYSDTDIF